MTLLFHDSFSHGLRVRAPNGRAAAGPWSLRPAGRLTAGDGVARPAANGGGLVIEPADRDPVTGQPRFAVSPPGEPVDHLRWSAFGPSLETAGATLTFSAMLSAETWGEKADEVGEGSGALIALDREAGLVLDFALTGRRLWALYGRVPGGANGRGGFSYSVPIAGRSSTDRHDCALVVDSGTGHARWILDGTEVFAVERLGEPLPAPARPDSSTPGALELVRSSFLVPGMALIAETPHGQGIRFGVGPLSVVRSSTTAEVTAY